MLLTSYVWVGMLQPRLIALGSVSLTTTDHEDTSFEMAISKSFVPLQLPYLSHFSQCLRNVKKLPVIVVSIVCVFNFELCKHKRASKIQNKELIGSVVSPQPVVSTSKSPRLAAIVDISFYGTCNVCITLGCVFVQGRGGGRATWNN